MIHTITATRQHPKAPPHHQHLYCFDDEAYGLIAEPLVESTTEAIRSVLRYAELPDAAAIVLRFCTDNAIAKEAFINEPWPVILLTCRGPKDDGHDYVLDCLHPQLLSDNWVDTWLTEDTTVCWLCPVLLDYFPEGAPKKLYVQIRPL